MASWPKLNQPIRTSKYTPNNHNIKTIYLVVLCYTADFDIDEIISEYSPVVLISILIPILLQHKGNLCWRSQCVIFGSICLHRLPCIAYIHRHTTNQLWPVRDTGPQGCPQVSGTVTLAADSLGPVGCTVAPRLTCSVFQILNGIEIVRLSDRDGSWAFLFCVCRLMLWQCLGTCVLMRWSVLFT